MRFEQDIRKYSEGYGFIAPFCLLVIGIFFLFKVPSLDDLTDYSGKIIYNQYLQVLQLEETNKKFILPEAQKETVFLKLKSAEYAHVWVKSGCADRCKIKQLKLDNELIIEYDYLKEVTVPIIFAAIGLLLIPIVIKSKKKASE
ncbi:MAG: hypothetical protein R6U95_02000 [Bacteroidales bacterium]